MSFNLLDYQRQTVDFGIKNKYCIYALDMGLGKTFTALTTAIETNSKTLIVCPSYLKLKWKSEIRKFFPDKTVDLYENAKDFYKPWDTDFVIISYSFVDKADMFFEWADMVIADECHQLKSIKAKRTEAFHRLIYENSIKRCLLLTGTPILNRVYELYSLIAICNYNPDIEESKFLKRFVSYVDFANYFSYLKEYEIFRGGRRVKVQEWTGSKNVDELKGYLKDIYIRFNSEDVLDIPPYVDIEVPVSFEDMPELLSEFDSFNEESSANSKAKSQAALLKVPFTIDYVKGLMESDRQVVVYTDHVESCEMLGKGLGVIGISGETPMKKREELAIKFMNGESKVIVATIGSFSTGIDLYSSFNMVFNDPNWVPGIMKQAKYRIRRLGQKNKCFFHHIIGTNQDKIINKKLEQKMAVIKEVL